METKDKTKIKNIILQDRDYEVLRYILEQKFLSREQIGKWFYKSPIQSKKRLWELGLSGYIRKESVVSNLKDHFLITNLGVIALLERGVNGIKPVDSIDIRFYYHNKTLTDIRLLFESIGLAKDWKTERALKSEGGFEVILKPKGDDRIKVPDGAFLSPSGKNIVLELELTPKVSDLYKEILKGYLESPNVDRVFYIVKGEDLFNRFLGEGRWKEKGSPILGSGWAGHRNKILICRLENLEKDPISAEVFLGSEKTTIQELIFHDKTVTDLRLLFENIGLARDWKSERVFRSEHGALEVPDGVFLSPAGKKIAFELELVPKENSLYKKILAGYQNVDRVFYVVRGDALFNRLRGLMTNKMLISRLEDIEKDALSAEVFWGNQKTTIKELIDAR